MPDPTTSSRSRALPPRRRSGLVLAFALACAAALSGGTARAADDDFDFAQGLSKRGYNELAEKIFRGILSDSKRSASEKAEGQYGLALMKAGDARLAAMTESKAHLKPFDEVIALFGSADTEIEQFIKRNGTHPRALEARLDRAKLLTDRADYVKKAIARGWATGTDELRASIAKNYDTAIDLLSAVEKKAKDKLKKLTPSDNEYHVVQDEAGLVWLFRIRALYGKGAALPKGDPAGTGALKAVQSEADEFAWDWDGTVRGLWANYYRALASWKLDEHKDAIKDMVGAAKAVTESQGTPGGLSIAMKCHEGAADIGIDLGERVGPEYLDAAVALFDGLPDRWPNYLDTAQGQLAALAWARVLRAAGRSAEGVALVQKVIQHAEKTGTRMDTVAGNVLGDMVASGGGAKSLDPALLSKIARSRSSDPRAAVKAYQAVVSSCDTDEEMDKFGWRAWQRIAGAYFAEGRFYECHVACETIQEAYRADQSNPVLLEITNDTGYQSAVAIDKLATATKDPEKRKEWRAIRDVILEQFAKDNPNSAFNQDNEAREFGKRLGELKAAARDGDMPKARALGEECAKLAGAIDPNGNSFDSVEADLASISMYLGDYDKAIAAAEAWLTKSRPEASNSDIRRARAKGKAIALSTILTSYARRPDGLEGDAKKLAYTELLGACDKYGADFADATTSGKRQLDQWRCEALIAAGKVDEADELVRGLLEADPNMRNGPFLAALVAKGKERQAAERDLKDDKMGAKRHRLRAAYLYEYAVKQGSKLKGRDPSAAAIKSIAEKFRKAGELDKAESYLVQALGMYEEAGETASADGVRIDVIGLFIDRKKYDEAIGPLEKQLVADDGKRAVVLEKLSAGTGKLTNVDIKELQENQGMSKKKGVLDTLSRAYFEAGRDALELVRAINLVNLLQFSTKRDDQHDEKWIEWRLREVEAYQKFADSTGRKEAYKSVVSLINSKVKTPGYLDIYEETLPGSKQRFETLLLDANLKK